MFRHRLLALTTLFALAFVAGCDSAPTHDSLMKEQIEAMEESVAVMKTIKDKDSAEAAKPKLQALRKEMDALKEKADKVGKPSKEKEAELKKQYEDRLSKVMQEMISEGMRISMDPNLGPVLKNLDGGPSASE